MIEIFQHSITLMLMQYFSKFLEYFDDIMLFWKMDFKLVRPLCSYGISISAIPVDNHAWSCVQWENSLGADFICALLVKILNCCTVEAINDDAVLIEWSIEKEFGLRLFRLCISCLHRKRAAAPHACIFQHRWLHPKQNFDNWSVNTDVGNSIPNCELSDIAFRLHREGNKQQLLGSANADIKHKSRKPSLFQNIAIQLVWRL